MLPEYKFSKQIQKAIQKSINYFGSYQKLSKALGITSSNVAHWAKGREPMPLHQAFKIQDMTEGKIRAECLRPEIFDYFNKKYEE